MAKALIVWFSTLIISFTLMCTTEVIFGILTLATGAIASIILTDKQNKKVQTKWKKI